MGLFQNLKNRTVNFIAAHYPILRYMPRLDEKTYIDIVKREPFALQCVKYQTPDICKAAVENNGGVLSFVRQQTSEICMAAVRQDWIALKDVKEQIPEMCMTAVKQSWRALDFIREPTLEMYLEAQVQAPDTISLLQHVQKQTPEICMAAVKNNVYELQYVKEQTPEICMMAVKHNAVAINFVKDKTPELISAAEKTVENTQITSVKDGVVNIDRPQPESNTIPNTKKYELVYSAERPDDMQVWRIRALKDFTTVNGVEIKAGDLGGLVSSEQNLSQEGNCWIFKDASALYNSRVYDNAILADKSSISGSVHVFGNAKMFDKSHASGGSLIYDDAEIHDFSIIRNSEICGNAVIYEDDTVIDYARYDGCSSTTPDIANYFNKAAYERMKAQGLKLSDELKSDIEAYEAHLAEEVAAERETERDYEDWMDENYMAAQELEM